MWNYWKSIHGNGGEFVLQVKKNSPELFEELMRLFEGLSEEKENTPEEFQDKYGSHYSEAKTREKNRERYKYRTFQSYSDPSGIQERRPYVASVGRARQVRIMQIQDDCGNDMPMPCRISGRGEQKTAKTDGRRRDGARGRMVWAGSKQSTECRRNAGL